ncbi:MAG: hypothetical protein ACFFFK_11850 [Candidatus Thorarchaeota archaeon]
MTRTESQNAPAVCAYGMVFIMLSVACAVAMGTVIRAETFIVGGLLLVVFSLIGGYLAGTGLLFIYRASEKSNSGNQD